MKTKRLLGCAFWYDNVTLGLRIIRTEFAFSFSYIYVVFNMIINFVFCYRAHEQKRSRLDKLNQTRSFSPL